MKKIIKVFGYILTILILISAAIYLYVFREQKIDVGLIPNEFTYCGKKIYSNNKNYREIVSWLKTNKTGWVSSFVTFLPGHTYSSGAFNVNVISDIVVVSYKTDYGYPQYVRTGRHSLNVKCE